MKLSVCVFVCLASAVSCANILAVYPSISLSHFVVFEALITELAKRGHKVTAVTTFPQKKTVENYTSVSVRPFRKVVLNNSPFKSFVSIPETFFSVAPKLVEYVIATENVLNAPEIIDLISSNSTFDLLLHEMFMDDVFLGFAHKFKAPVIAFGSCYMFPWVADRFGIPENPSHIPTFYSGFSGNMNFYERFHNTFLDFIGKLFFKYRLEPPSTGILRKYFGNSTPPVRDLVKKVSLYFINSHFSFFGAQQFPPQVVDVSGIHLEPAKHLSQVFKIISLVKLLATSLFAGLLILIKYS